MGLKQYFIKRKEQEHIEAEEIFLDAQAIRSLEEKGKLEQPIKRTNFILLFGLIVLGLSVLFLRTAYLQIIKGNYYSQLAEGNKRRIYLLEAPRGLIYDFQGQPLVYNVSSFDLMLIPADFFNNSPAEQQGILKKIAQVANQSISGLEKKIEANKKEAEITLLKEISQDEVLVIKTLINQWSGLRLKEKIKRQYVSSPVFSHLLGYLGQLSPADLEKHPELLPSEQIGKSGLELTYDSYLRGRPGQEQVEIDAQGRSQRVLAVKEPQPGQSLVLSIDKELEERLYLSLEQTLKKFKLSKAVGLALNPQNGALLALVSLPGFDHNLFAQGIDPEKLKALNEDPAQPLFNRAVAGEYPPGSTIKPLIGAAALEEKVISPRRSIYCPGQLVVASKYNPNILYHFLDWKSHGSVDIIKAIAQSCNVFFYTISGGYGPIKGLGIKKIKKYLKRFGLGQLTGIDLPFEKTGLIPDPEWKKQVKPDEEWFLGDTYHLGIGQGDVLVTPLQMATAIAAVANGGILYQPQVVDKIIDAQQNLVKDIPPQVVREGFISPAHLKIIQQGMREAVLSGSARALADLPVKVAGKTGTAQFGNQGKTQAWFIGYAPEQEPVLLLAILIEEGGEGHQTAVPVAKEVFSWYFGNK